MIRKIFNLKKSVNHMALGVFFIVAGLLYYVCFEKIW